MPGPKPAEKCPCGSGFPFQNCCSRKDFKWRRQVDGRYARVVPISKELAKILEELKDTFVKHFEREPGKQDPVFLGKYLAGEHDLERETVRAMKKAGIAPSKIYAYKKTGHLLARENERIAPTSAMQEWRAAIEEFYERGEAALTGGPEGEEFDTLLHQLEEELETLIYLFGLATDNFFNSALISRFERQPEALCGTMSPNMYKALCIVRVHRTLRSIKELVDQQMAEDVLRLSRSIYDNYLHIIFVSAFPQKIEDLVDARLGLRAGSHSYQKKPNGQEDKRIIVDNVSGRKFEGHISAHRMASASSCPSDLAFFDHYYSMTSDLVHPSIFHVEGYITDGALDPTRYYLHEEGLIYSIVVSCMVAEQLLGMKGCPKLLRRDVRTVITRIRSRLMRTLDLLEIWQTRTGAKNQDLSILRTRCQALPSRSRNIGRKKKDCKGKRLA